MLGLEGMLVVRGCTSHPHPRLLVYYCKGKYLNEKPTDIPSQAFYGNEKALSGMLVMDCPAM